MKTKILIALVLGLVLNSQLYADDEKNPCGALLCLLAAQTGGECRKYYEYYTIGLPKECYKKCKNKLTIATCMATCIPTKQISHLKNCKMIKASNEDSLPIDQTLVSQNNQFFNNLDSKVNQFSQIKEEDCTKKELNRVEKVVLRTVKKCEAGTGNGGADYCYDEPIYGYRINPNPTQACKVLSSQEFSLLKISYTCSHTVYEAQDWNNGFTKTKISKEEYDKLAQNDKMSETLFGTTFYYKKNFINKDCWEVEGRWK